MAILDHAIEIGCYEPSDEPGSGCRSIHNRGYDASADNHVEFVDAQFANFIHVTSPAVRGRTIPPPVTHKCAIEAGGGCDNRQGKGDSEKAPLGFPKGPMPVERDRYQTRPLPNSN